MKTRILTIIMLTAAFVLNAQSPWTQKASMPAGKLGHSAIVLNGKIYIVGGVTTTPGVALKNLDVYDPVLNSWTSKADMTTGRTSFGTCIVNGKILAFGGGQNFYSNPIISIEEYNPVSDSWTYKTNMPRARSAHTASLVNGKVYLIGGWSGDWDDVSEVDVYDTLTKTWTTVSNLPTPRSHLSAVTLNGKIYAIGGVTDPEHGETSLRTVEMYDPEADTWTTKASMITDKKSVSACALSSKIYAFGGTSGFCKPCLPSVEVYDPETDTWTEIENMPVALAAHAVAIMNEKAYINGGSTTTCPVTVISETYEYDPHHDLFPLIEKTAIDKSYFKPGVDSVWITTKMKATSGISIVAEFNAPDQTPIDSIPLYDDGNHNDGAAGDSLYANVWKVGSSEEQRYYVDLHITRIDADTAIHQMKNMALFTTIGPVEYDSYLFTGDDTEPNPGDHLIFELTISNIGTTATATNITAELFSLDTLVYVSNYSCSFSDISAGESATSNKTFNIWLDNKCPINTDVFVGVNISSDGYVFWSDTFSIRIEPPTSIISIENSIARIYPNPVHDELTIAFIENTSTKTSIALYDITGKIVYSENLVGKTPVINTIDLSYLKNGLYLIHISNEQYSYTEKMIKVE